MSIPAFDKDEILKRLLKKRQVNPATNCWEWMGAKTKQTYGLMSVGGRPPKGKMMRIPRLSAYVFWGFQTDSELCICHRCDNPSCFNPDHLFEGSQKENVQDAWRKGRCEATRRASSVPKKLNDDSIHFIRILLMNGRSHRDIAQMFEVSHNVIGGIHRGELHHDG